MEEAWPQVPFYTGVEGTLLPGVRKTKAPPWASPGQAAGHGVRPQHRHQVHGAQQQRAHLLMLLQCLAQVLQLLRQLPDLSPQHCVFLFQALIFLGKTENGQHLKTHSLLLPSWQICQHCGARLLPAKAFSLTTPLSTTRNQLLLCLMSLLPPAPKVHTGTA